MTASESYSPLVGFGFSEGLRDSVLRRWWNNAGLGGPRGSDCTEGPILEPCCRRTGERFGPPTFGFDPLRQVVKSAEASGWGNKILTQSDRERGGI